MNGSKLNLRDIIMAMKRQHGDDEQQMNAVDDVKLKNKKCYRSSFWTFTLHGDMDSFQQFEALITTKIGNEVKWCKYQEEENGDGHHLQGIIQMSDRVNLRKMINSISNTAHWEVVRNFWASKEYVSKMETSVCKGMKFEKGEWTSPGRVKRAAESYTELTAKRHISVIDMFGEGLSRNEVADRIINDQAELIPAFEKAQQMYHMQQLAILHKKAKEAAIVMRDNFFPWQTRMYAILQQKPDPRHVYWIYDPVGNTGKTEFVKTYRSLFRETTCRVSNGKKNDMLYSASMTVVRRVVFIDIPRAIIKTEQEENKCFINFIAIEDLKNGTFNSDKYCSTVVDGEPPHLLCLANFLPPDLNQLSLDR